MAKQKVYAAKVGREGPKIYNTWWECERQVKGFSGAQYQAFDTLEEALKWLGIERETVPMAPPLKAPPLYPDQEDNCCYAVDTGKGYGEAYVLKIAGAKKICTHTIPPDFPNDVLEFIALVLALQYCKENVVRGTIYSRNATAVRWVQDYQLDQKFSDPALMAVESEWVTNSIAWLTSNKLWNEYAVWPKGWGDMLEYLDKE